MCGIAGIASARLSRAQAEASARAMSARLAHRGPDGEGALSREGVRVTALAHRRLAIVDLSPTAAQPMVSDDGLVSIVYNGEVYNFPALRQEMEAKGVRFRSTSDTEVVLRLYEAEGAACLRRLNGIFALAILDERQGTILLARDPLGVKPLYYAATSDGIVFASEIRALMASGVVSTEVDAQSLWDYFTFHYVPCPATIYSAVRQLPPGHWLSFDIGRGTHCVERYHAFARRDDIAHQDEAALRARLRELVAASVRRQLVADVPVGVFLSGGIDSTIVAGLAREATSDVRTFTMTFPDAPWLDEAPVAEAVAHHLGTTHQALVAPAPTPHDVLDVASQLDQPFGNPTFHLLLTLARSSRAHVTVALCGAGGDELFAGYPRHRAMALARTARRVPKPLRRLARATLRLAKDRHQGPRLRRAREFLDGLDDDPVVSQVRWTYFLDEDEKARLLTWTKKDPPAPSSRIVRTAVAQSPLPDPESRALDAEVQTFLLDNLLEYTDKASMAVGMEVRVPLLDVDLVEFALNVPFSMKLQGGRSKAILRDAFADLFPAEAARAPKRGFVAPISKWLDDGLDAYFEAARDADHPLRREWPDAGASFRDGILSLPYVDELRADHRAGRVDHADTLYAIIVFDLWWGRRNLDAAAPSARGSGGAPRGA